MNSGHSRIPGGRLFVLSWLPWGFKVRESGPPLLSTLVFLPKCSIFPKSTLDYWFFTSRSLSEECGKTTCYARDFDIKKCGKYKIALGSVLMHTLFKLHGAKIAGGIWKCSRTFLFDFLLERIFRQEIVLKRRFPPVEQRGCFFYGHSQIFSGGCFFYGHPVQGVRK